MPDTPDQPLINELARKLGGEPTPNGKNGHHKHTTSVLSDDQVIELCRKAKNAAKFSHLFDAGHTDDYSSASEADMALISIMAFYSQDFGQLDRLYQQSALMRPKWQRNDYRERTINRVLANLTETYQPVDGASLSLSSSPDPLYMPSDDDNYAGVVWFSNLGEPKKREYLLKDVCAKGYPLVAFGAGGVAKSFAMLSAGIAIAGGLDEWFGLRVLDHGYVLYADFELDLDEQHRRVRDLCAGLGIGIPDKLAYLSGVGVTNEKAFSHILRFCKEYEAKTVVLDSMGLAMQGDMEQAKDVLAFHAKYINPIRRAGATPFIVDHEGKRQAGEKHRDKSPFGSAYKAWAARSILQFELDEYNRETGELDIRVRQTKTNFGPQLEPFGVRFTFECEKVSTETYELEDAELAEEESVPARDRIIGALHSESATRHELEKLTGLSGGTIRNKLSDLMKDELVEVEGYQGRAKVYSLLSSSPNTYRGTNGDDKNPGVSEDDADLVQRARQALDYGNGPKKALENYRSGDQDLEAVVKSVMHYYGRGKDDVERWREPVTVAVDQELR
jgi:RecA-family ATPase